jgi:hypothetical protein
LLYMGVGGIVRLLMLSEFSLYTQGWFFFGIFVVCHTTLLPLGSWYIAFFPLENGPLRLVFHSEEVRVCYTTHITRLPMRTTIVAP